MCSCANKATFFALQSWAYKSEVCPFLCVYWGNAGPVFYDPGASQHPIFGVEVSSGGTFRRVFRPKCQWKEGESPKEQKVPKGGFFTSVPLSFFCTQRSLFAEIFVPILSKLAKKLHICIVIESLISNRDNTIQDIDTNPHNVWFSFKNFDSTLWELSHDIIYCTPLMITAEKAPFLWAKSLG